MASRRNSVVLSLFVVAVVFGATACMAGPPPPVFVHQLSEYNDGIVQSIGK
jgi:hypothetical protein